MCIHLQMMSNRMNYRKVIFFKNFEDQLHMDLDTNQ